MELTWFLIVLGFLWGAAITPGPNNMLLTTSGANLGFWRSLPVMAGIILGMQVLLGLLAIGVGSVLVAFPTLHLFLKIIGSLYLLWIAYKMAHTGTAPVESSQLIKPVRFYQAALLQFLNPKAWLMGLGAITSYSLPSPHYVASVGAIALAMLLVNLVAGCIWLSFGTVIGRWLHNQRARIWFNLSMALLTAACVVFIWR